MKWHGNLMKCMVLTLLTTLTVLASNPAIAATLLAGDQAGNLYSVDTVTGVGTPIGQETGFPLSTEIEYDFGTGTLYADETNGAINLHTLDIATGLSTGFVPHPCCALNGMEFVGPVLYGTNIEIGGGPSTLVVVDTVTGAYTPIGLTGTGPISGLAYDSGSATMYGVTAGGAPAVLVTLNLTTGLATPVANLVDAAGAPLSRVGSIEFASDGVLYGGFGSNAAVNAGSLVSIDTTTGVSTLIGPTGMGGITGLTAADTVTDASGRVGIRVTKTFTDGSTDSVDVTLTCNSGLPLVQDFTIAGGDPAGVTFVVTDLPPTGATCTVTETGGPDGYTPILNGGAGCEFTDVTGGFAICEIVNAADPATFIVNKVWEVSEAGGGDDVVRVAEIIITCDAEIVGGYQDDGSGSEDAPTGIILPSGDWMYDGTVTGDDSLEVEIDTSMGPATCSAEETSEQSGVESTDDCGPREIDAGETSECTITNTVFFEGIPSLNQYGLAIMALLMLGLGMVGFRRFV